MAFGDFKGPPATHGQVKQLTELVESAGHSDFRDARGPLGLTQRQAGGKFTRDEAEALIERLETEQDTDTAPTNSSHTGLIDRREAKYVATLRKTPDDLLAAELQRRGWIVVEPD